MRHFAGHILGVDQGSVAVAADCEDGGPMWTGSGPRERRHRVAFARPFRGSPVVQASLAMWDVDAGANTRIELRTEAVEAAGFTLVFRTWGDSWVARARADWIALGEVWGDGDWPDG